MAESWASKKFRWGFNFFPVYRRTGGRVSYISADFHELHVRLPLNFWTRNYVGTIYGGSMYASCDPMYMLMLMRILGNDFIVWDKAATIKFLWPGTETLTCTFLITPEQVAEMKAKVEEKGETDYYFTTWLVDKSGKKVAEIDKTIYVATKAHYKQKLAKKKG